MKLIVCATGLCLGSILAWHADRYPNRTRDLQRWAGNLLLVSLFLLGTALGQPV
jgi:hypothetical protein